MCEEQTTICKSKKRKTTATAVQFDDFVSFFFTVFDRTVVVADDESCVHVQNKQKTKTKTNKKNK